MSFKEDLKTLAVEYLNDGDESGEETPSSMLLDFVIEKYKQHRNFPSSFTDTKIEADMENHIAAIAMAVVDLYNKTGAEGEVSHSENGIARSYENAYISNSVWKDIMPYVKPIG